MANLTAMTNQAKVANGANICHVCGEFSNLMPKRGPLESGDFDENREYDENSANRARSTEKVPNVAKIRQSLVENFK